MIPMDGFRLCGLLVCVEVCWQEVMEEPTSVATNSMDNVFGLLGFAPGPCSCDEDGTSSSHSSQHRHQQESVAMAWFCCKAVLSVS